MPLVLKTNHTLHNTFSKLILCAISLVTVSLAVLPSTAQAKTDTDNFTISSYNIDYSLGRDDEGHSKLQTTETIVAEFPEADQNRGLERAITKDFNGHTTGLKIQSVTDEKGDAIEYTAKGRSDFEVLRIGNPDEYVHGSKTYVITYTQHDVTKSYDDTKKDEFYWDTNGTDWRVPIAKLSVNLRFEPSVVGALDGTTACYQGELGNQSSCVLYQEGAVYSASATNLKPGENVTLAVGFEPGTFVAYVKTPFETFFQLWIIAQIIIAALSIPLFVWFYKRHKRQSDRTKEQTPIVPEYLPPKNASVAISAHVLSKLKSGRSAELIDLAVRKYIKIYQTESVKILKFAKNDYSLEIIRSIDDLRPEEQEFLRDIFNNKTGVGSKLALSELKKDTKLYARLADNPKKLQDLERGKYSLQQKVPAQSTWFNRAAIILLIAGILLLSPTLLLVAFYAYCLASSLWPLTDEGLSLVRYLNGLKMYIKTAEQERLKMLQSPEGANKIAIDTNDTTQLVKLYEKLLPYAILFGQEKEWNKELGKYYETSNTQPDWYTGAAGVSAFNATSFSQSMSSFTSSAAGASSEGGSTGGGYSGGGGGGGGGGGW